MRSACCPNHTTDRHQLDQYYLRPQNMQLDELTETSTVSASVNSLRAASRRRFCVPGTTSKRTEFTHAVVRTPTHVYERLAIEPGCRAAWRLARRLAIGDGRVWVGDLLSTVSLDCSCCSWSCSLAFSAQVWYQRFGAERWAYRECVWTMEPSSLAVKRLWIDGMTWR